MGTPAQLLKPPSREINLGISGWQRVFITHVQHYKAEIEPESYSLVIDLFSIVWRLENSNESSRNWKCHGRTTRQFSTLCTMPK